MKQLKIDNSWTLFLDRDGVINEKLKNDYVKNWAEFTFTDRLTEAIEFLSKVFGKIIIVTNQRGVGKGLMTEKQLKMIHLKMTSEIKSKFGRIDKIYYCVNISDFDECRKPNIGMGIQAKNDYPEIDFMKSVMIGDSFTDMEFGKRLGMKTIFIGPSQSNNFHHDSYDFIFFSLFEYSKFLKSYH